MRALLELSSLTFRLVPHPDWSAFFTLDFQLGNPQWVITKLGHFSGFAIMDLLFLNCLKRGKLAVACSVVFAIGTEILQVPFGRDGRLYDVGIDTLGILCAGTLVALDQAMTKRK
ncbi:VanZ family protein [Alicyclobacillus fastidiosus]|uniref:VanZ family protein n=1 Tax=Alicyclobacillus fastidiosus TaxID=392011 RepID=A0ABV5AAG0_9BACL|nr:VanZ family protein [Alicyclobacillus fastidiosus]WEH07607.1 VanZ family protein [Alicyclobacillus fastidiosus]